MPIVTANTDLSSITYARRELFSIQRGAELRVTASPTVRPGTMQALGPGTLFFDNPTTTPLVFELDDEVNDLNFRAGGLLKARGVPMELAQGTGGAQVYNFATLFGGAIKQLTYCAIEETPGSGSLMPWPIVHEDPKFQLDCGTNTAGGGATPAAFSAGNTPAGKVLFWHETNRTLRCGDGVNGAAIPAGCRVYIPSIYINNRYLTNSGRVIAIDVTGSPTGGSFQLEFRNEAGAVIGTTAAIAYNAANATVDSALEAVLGAGTVTIGSGPLPTSISITFGGALTSANGGFGDIPSVRVVNQALTGGTNPQVMVRQNSTANMSLLSLTQGFFDCEWVSFGPGIHVAVTNFAGFRSIHCGYSSSAVQFSDSNGSLSIYGGSHSISPFVASTTRSFSAVQGAVSVERFAAATKLPNSTLLSVLPGLTKLDRITSIAFGKRNSTSNRSIDFRTLPTGATLSNLVAVGATMSFTNTTSCNIAGYSYADGTLSGPQETAQAVSVVNLANAIDCVFSNMSTAGPQSPRAPVWVVDSACSGNQIIAGGLNLGNNSNNALFLTGTNPLYQNQQYPNLRGGTFVDTVSTFLAKGAVLRKMFATFATAPGTNNVVDASEDGVYDMVTCPVTGIAKSFAAGSFVGGNYTDPGLTPTTGHVTFGPFGAGTSLELTGAAYTNAAGAFFLPDAGDQAVITMPFAMHGITGFANTTPGVWADVPNLPANQAVVQAPGAPTGGTFTLDVWDEAGTFLGTTTPIAYNATTTPLRTPVEALPGVTPGITTGGSITSGFQWTFAGGQKLRFAVNGAGLTGGNEPGVAYAAGRFRLLDGSEALGAVNTYEFAMRVPGTAWPAYQSLTGANLAAAIPALTGYAPGGSGLEMRLRITAGVSSPLTQYSQISMATTVNPALWALTDASVTLNGPQPTDVTRVLRKSDNVELYSFTGAGVREFELGNNFAVEVCFRRENAAGVILMQDRDTTKLLRFGDNGVANLFYGPEVQLAQAGLLPALEALLNTRLDARVSDMQTEAAAASRAAAQQAEHDATQAAIAAMPTAPSAATVAGAVWSQELETGFSASRILRCDAATSAGANVGDEENPVYRNLSNTADQVTGTADEEGRRSLITYGA